MILISCIIIVWTVARIPNKSLDVSTDKPSSQPLAITPARPFTETSDPRTAFPLERAGVGDSDARMASNNSYGASHVAAALIKCSQQITPQIGWTAPLLEQVRC